MSKRHWQSPARVLRIAGCFVLATGMTAQIHAVEDSQSDYVSQCENHMTKTVSRLPVREQGVEVRTLSSNAGSSLTVRGGENGGIVIHGGNDNEIVVVACKSVWADDEEGARGLLKQVVTIAQNGEVRAQGPSRADHAQWSVNFILFVPQDLAMQLLTKNGGISLYEVHGPIKARSENGGILLRASTGEMDLESHNGGIELNLMGHDWRGKGLRARSENGSLILRVPKVYRSGIYAQTASTTLECKAVLCGESEKTWDSQHKILQTPGSAAVINLSTEHAPLEILSAN